jgi:Electron transfer DM13
MHLAAIPIAAAVILAGLWVFAGLVAPGYYTSIAFGVAWFVLASIAIGVVARRTPSLKWPLRATYLVIVLLVGGWTAWTTFTDDVVDEQVVTGAPATRAGAATSGNVQLASGPFEGLAHGASGTAAIVELTSGERKLTFSELDTDNGPDLRVYLVAGTVTGDTDVEDFVDLGRLKGNKGSQQYTIPDGTDTDRYRTVVIWCRAFTVSFAKAELERS